MYSKKAFKMKLSLNCIILGRPKKFTINIPKKYTDDNLAVIEYDSLTVSNFIEIIANKVKDFPDRVNLWVVDVDEKGQKNLENISEKDIKNKFGGNLMEDIYQFKDYFPDGFKPTLRHIHIIIVPEIPSRVEGILTEDTSNKRIKLEDSRINNTPKFLNELLVPFDEPIDCCNNFVERLSEPLLKKLPSLYPELLPDLLDSSISNITRELNTIVDAIMGSKVFKGSPGGEAFTSRCTDRHIVEIIELAQAHVLGCGNIEVDHNKTIHTSGKKQQLDRPDVTIYYNRVLVMIGEEKDLESKIKDAEKDLDFYFSYWNPLAFGRLPLVFAFAAAGSKLQFYYYYYARTSNSPIRVKIGDTLVIGGQDRLFNYLVLRHTINFIRILQTWNRDKILETPKLKLFEVIQRANDGHVSIHPKKVCKYVIINSDAETEFYQKFYNEIFPKLGGQYKKIRCFFSRNSMQLELEPVGYTTLPTTENELCAAILDVLKIVKILHENNCIHRDIRWDNIIRLMDNSWALIDFEEAAFIGETRPTLNIAAPEHRNQDSCTEAGDIWLIGNLIDVPRIHFDLSENAENFRTRLKSQDPGERPTAANAIKDDWFNDM